VAADQVARATVQKPPDYGRRSKRAVRLASALGYASVSTSGQNLEVQRRRLRDEAKVVRVFEDVICGRSLERFGLTALRD
jgi:hypothetical protein